jgi:signal transduction histidine kinase/CheY-like chemotaxis protein
MLQAEQLRMYHVNLPYEVGGSMLGGLVLAFVHWGAVSHGVALGWVALLACVHAVRILNDLHDRHTLKAQADNTTLLRRAHAHSIALGLTWGLSGWLFFSAEHIELQSFLATILVGMMAAWLTVSALDLLAVLVVNFLVLTPFIVRLLLDGGTIQLAIAVMGVLFLGFTTMIALRAHGNARENVALRHADAVRAEALHEARDAAESASRAKSEFLASMSHELRTPLNAILGFSQLFSMDEALTQETRDNALEIERAGQHLLSLVNDLIDLARIEAGKLEISMEPVPLESVLEESLAMVAPLAGKQHIALVEEGGDGLAGTVRADYVRLRQILINLLSNAIKYNRPQGSVYLSVRQQQGEREGEGVIRITIRDTGPGIAADKQERIFNSFDRLGAERGHVEGTGIGLVITQRIVLAMGGRIGFESQEGQGSTFWVEFPVCAPAKHPVLHSIHLPEVTSVAEVRAAPDRPQVLCIEDNPMNQRLMRQIFSTRPDLQLHEANTAEDGIAQAFMLRPNLILLDINLPGMNGYEALKILKTDRRTAHIPVIGVSANAMQGDASRALEAGFSSYITKPIDVPLFLSAVDQAVMRTAQS